ncbi:MAG: hypothetical protein AAGC56_05965 [Pseudomonadota bacterium]
MSLSTHGLFEALVAVHIAAGAPGLVGFWVPTFSKKGGPSHRLWGRIFAVSMLIAGAAATAMATMSVLAPMTTHPHLVGHAEFGDPQVVRAIFGWMMVYLAILTINLAWYGWSCVRNRGDHAKNRAPLNMALQAILFVAALNCAVRGVMAGQLLMVGISFVGFATVATNLWFMLKLKPRPVEWLLEHIKGIVGTGISVYTAFFAFGAVRLLPEAALTPALWSVPLVVGLSLIIYHQQKVLRRFRRPAAASAPPGSIQTGPTGPTRTAPTPSPAE